MNLVDVPPELREALGGEFTLERELRGGMSRVFVARDERLGRRVVVKLLDPELAAGVSVDRFNREIQLAAKLQHPNIVPVLSAGVAGRLPYYMMPFVEGESLRLRLARGQLSVIEAVRILRDVARALSYAHERGIVHRDIKPDNILLTAGAAVVADFGVAKALSSARRPIEGHTHTITHAGTALGTPTYMAPEQASADPNADHRADLYSLGAMAFEMLAGRPPFVADAPQKLFVAHLTEPPPSIATFRADVPERLAELIMQCLRKEASDRPQSAAAVAMALDDPQVVSGAFATMSTGAIVNPVRHRRNRMFATGALIVGVVLITVIATRYLTPTSAVSPPGRIATPGAPAVAPSLAVLPFVNIGSDSADNYLAEGLSE
jgi:serine/threonine-protein kinase